MSVTCRRRSPFAITGLGAVSALGHGCDALWEGIEAGRDGIGSIDRFSTRKFSVALAATVPGATAMANEPKGGDGLATRFAVRAATEAWDQAQVHKARLPAKRIGLVMGCSLGDRGVGLHHHAEAVAEHIGVGGPRITVSTACCSSTNAIGLACDLLASGMVDLVLAGGTDALTPELFAGFHALGVMCPIPCAPFSEPVGMTLGEGAGFVVVEDEVEARRRGAAVQALVLGYGLAGDGYHETAPDPSGAGVARALEGALAHAGLKPDHIGYVNVHGTGTAANDPAEWRALQQVFGERAGQLPLSSSKSFLGHAQGAAGVLETIVTILAMRRQSVPPTMHFTRPRPGCPADPVASSTPRRFSYRRALCSNSAFGGVNAAVAVGMPSSGKPEDSSLSERSSARAERRPVRVLGAGAVAAHGLNLSDLERALKEGQPLDGRVPEYSVEKVVRGVDPRGMDPSTRYLITAAHQAISDAGLRVRGRQRDRAGLVVGISRLSAESLNAFRSSISERGLARLSAPAFARMVLNAPAGSCSMSLSLKGLYSTITTGDSSGLVAVAYAAQMLATRCDSDLLVAGGLDELPPDTRKNTRSNDRRPVVARVHSGEGAACLALGAGTLDNADDNEPIYVVGWGVAGPGDAPAAVQHALRMASAESSEVEAVFGHVDTRKLRLALGDRAEEILCLDPTPVFGHAESSTSALASVAAVQTLRRGVVGTALVVAADGQSASCAVILRRKRRTAWTPS